MIHKLQESRTSSHIENMSPPVTQRSRLECHAPVVLLARDRVIFLRRTSCVIAQAMRHRRFSKSRTLMAVLE